MTHGNLLSLALLASAASLSFFATPALAVSGTGTDTDPYYGTVSSNIFSSYTSGDTVYVGTADTALGGSGTNSYIAGTLTITPNIVINAGGVYLTNGNSYNETTGANLLTFTGSISGTGNWTVTGDSGSTVDHGYLFTGDLSSWSGNLSIVTNNSASHVYYGNGGTAATTTNVSGKGSINVYGTVTFNYAAGTAVTIGNSSITALTLEFGGAADYNVSSKLTGYNTSSKLTISSTGTTTFSGTVSGFSSIVSRSAISVASTGSFDISGSSVTLASAIQNSGTVILDGSTTFVLDGLTATTGSLSSGEATYTLITGSTGTIKLGEDSLTSENISSLTTSNVSSSDFTITGASFTVSSGTLSVTVTTTGELLSGLHGTGSVSSPYYTTGSNAYKFEFSTSNFTAAGTTVYLATDEQSFGSTAVDFYWSTSFTAACDIVIGKAGICLTDGGSGQYYNFTGAISGEGGLTTTNVAGSTTGGSVAQHYGFTGDLSGWSGDITIATSNAYDYLIFGGTITGANGETGNITGISATQAATNESVSGTGAIYVDYGSVEYVYTAGAGGTTGETLTVTNKSIEAHQIIFTGGVNYEVSSDLTGWDNTSGTSSSGSTLEISTAGTVTASGKVSNFDIVTVASGSTLAIASGGSLDISGTTVTLASAIQNSGTITVSESTSFVIDGMEMGTGGGTSNDKDYYIVIAGGDGASITGRDSLTIDSFSGGSIDSSWSVYTGDGYLVIYGEAAKDLTWDGGSNTWNTSDTNWSGSSTFKSGDNVTFSGASGGTITLGEAITAGSITITGSSNYTISNGEGEGTSLNATSITVTANNGTTTTIDVSTLEVEETIYIKPVSGDSTGAAHRVLVIGSDTTTTTATAGALFMQGSSELQISKGSTLTVSGDLTETGGFDETISGEGTLIIKGTATHSTTKEWVISIANFQAGALTISGTGTATFSGGNTTITGALDFTGAGTLVVSNGATVSVGSLTDTDANASTRHAATIKIAEGSILSVGSMAFETGAAGSICSTFSGTSNDSAGTLIANSLTIGGNTAGASVEMKDITFITGGITFGGTATSSSFYLFLDNVTLGFTEDDVTIAATTASSSTSIIELGDKTSGSLTTTSDASTTTINTSKYSTTDYAFSDTEGVNVTIGANITGTDATLAVEGNGSLTLSGTTTVDALKLSSGELNIAGTTSVSSGLTVSGGTLSVSETGSLDLAGSVELSSAIQNAGTITIADGASIVVGVDAQTYNGDVGYYVLIDGSSGNSSSVTLNGSVTFVIGDENITLSSIIQHYADSDSWNIYTEDGYLVIYGTASTTAQTAENLYWAGTEDNNTWVTGDSSIDWSTADDGSAGYYFDTGANVTFGENATNKTVVLGGDITAGTVNITGSGYTLTGTGNTLTATSIVLDDEDSDTEHKFTIDTGVTVTAGSLEEKAGQLDLVVNGSLEVTTMTVTNEQSESISGSGKLKVGSLTVSTLQGTSLTIAVSEATFGSISIVNHSNYGTSDDSSADGYHSLIIGDGQNETKATVTGNLEMTGGTGEVAVAAGSTLTVQGTLIDSSGFKTSISGDGTLIADALSITANSGNNVQISVANLQVGTFTIGVHSGSGEGDAAVTISSAKFTADSLTYSSKGNLTISSAEAVIGSIESGDTHTLTIADGGKLTTGEIYRSGSTLNLTVNGELYVEKLEAYTGSTGMLYFGKSDSATSMAQTLSGSGTANIYGIEANLNGGSLTISVTSLNIGEGGIAKNGTGTVNIDGTTIGLYNTTASEISAAITIGSNGVTFNPGSGEKLTLSGTVTGNGLVTKTGEGELAFTGTGSSLTKGLTVSAGTVSVADGASLSLGGTVTLASAISNSGTITIADSTSFVINGIEMGTSSGGNDYYVLITGSGDGSSVSFNGSISIDSFTLSNGSLEGTWSVWSDGLNQGYLVIYGEAQAEVSDLTWAGTDEGHVWNTSNTNWKDNDATEESVAFTTGSNVTFDDTAENKNVELGENITAGTVKITGSGYTLTATNTAGENEYNLTATELILADTDSDSGEHTFTIAEGTKVEVGKLTEEVGQMNLVVNGDLKVDGDMHVDASANEVISGSGTFYVRDFTYDAAQGSSLTISVADASFTTLYERPSESDSNDGDYRKLIIGSEEGGAEYSTEVWVSDGLTLAGKSELRVNENSCLYTNSLIDSSDCDTLISGEGYLLANYVTFSGSGEVTISIAMFDAGDITFSNEGKLTISSSNYFLAYTAEFSNSGDITIAEGANVIIGEATSTVSHTITVEEGATFTVGSLDQTQNQLTLVVNGTMNVEKGLEVDEYYTGSTSGTLSFGTEDSGTKLEGSHSISGDGTANIYKLEYGADGAGLEISVANLNIGAGGISAAEGASSLILDGVTVGVYAGLDEDNTSWSTEASLTLKNDVTFNTKTGESITLAGAVETDEGSSLTKTGEGDLTLAGEATLSGLTVSGGTLSVAADASLALSGEVTLATAISNSGTITIDSDTSFVIDGIGSVLDLEKEKVYYVVVEGTNGAELTYEVNDGSKFTVGNGTLSGWSVYTTDGYLVIYRDADMTLIWDGTSENFVWNKDTTNTDWKVEDTTNTYFFDGANVIFDTIGASGISSEVKIADSLTAGTITVNDEYSFTTEVTGGVVVQTSGLEFGENGKLTIGDDVTVQIVGDEPLTGFSVDGTIIGTGTLQLELTADSDYSATVNLGTQNEFAGTVYITAGNFTLNGSDIGNGTYRLGNGVNMQVTSSGVEVGNNFILEGTSEVHINADDSLTINGNISGVETDEVMGGVFDRQGAGSLTINGDVNIGTFVIDSSGSDAVSSTTFSGESVTIGTLDVKDSDSVVFTNSGVNIGKIVFGEEETGTIEFKNGGTVGEIDYTERLGSGTIIVSSGTLNVGTIVDTFSGEAANVPMVNLQVGEGAVLHAETITIAPGGAGSVYSTISGIEDGGAGTVIVDNFIVGAEASDSGGTSIEVSDVTLIVGALSFGNGESSNFNLYLKNATLGFTENVTISATTASGSNSRLVIGGFAGSNSTATGSDTKTTINTSKYVVDSTTGTGAFSTTDGVTVTISQIISGQGELEVTGVGKLILSAANEYSGGTTIKEGATVVAQNESALGSGNVTVNSGATLELDTYVSVTASSDVTFAEGASIVLGGSLLDSILDSADTGEAVAVITANTITFGDVSVSSFSDDDSLSSLVNQYVTSGNQYGITWSWSDGTLWAVAAIPEPELFSIFFGLGALGLVATRRRRRKVA